MEALSFKAPTYEEVLSFAKSEGLAAKTNVAKFYEYYKKDDFLYKGMPMNWKEKLRKWAGSEKQKKKSYVTAAEATTEHKEKLYGYWTREELNDLMSKVEDFIKGG